MSYDMLDDLESEVDGLYFGKGEPLGGLLGDDEDLVGDEDRVKKEEDKEKYEEEEEGDLY
jgi:hypothetical protein